MTGFRISPLAVVTDGHAAAAAIRGKFHVNFNDAFTPNAVFARVGDEIISRPCKTPIGQIVSL